MKVLLDACVPAPLRRFLLAHQVSTAQEMGWGRLKNGELLASLEGRFDVFVTSDRNLRYQQNLAERAVAIIILPTNDWPVLRGMASGIATAVDRATPGSITEIPSP